MGQKWGIYSTSESITPLKKEQKIPETKSTKNRHRIKLKPMAHRPQRGRCGVKAE